MRKVSVCTYCGVGCDVAADIKNGKIEKMYALPEGVVSRGKLCVKGKYGWEYLYSPDKIKNARIKKEFLKREYEKLKANFGDIIENLKEFDAEFYEIPYTLAYDIAAFKLKEITQKYGADSFAAIGGARTNCESSYLFQKFTREVIGSPHVDNCARVCHSPSLKGLKETIGEGAATNPFDDIYETEFMLVIGSNTTEAHPIVANRILEAIKNNGAGLGVIDVREIALSKFANYHLSIPYETNLMIFNMLAFVILSENLENRDFINKRTKGFEEYRKNILEDEFANPEILSKIRGYEDLPEKIRAVARLLATKKSLIIWGLGVSEHIDGSYAVMALANLAMLTGNIGKKGAGLMPLRGQNNVQGTCDMGCLPYFLPDYKTPKKIGLMTPDLIDAMNENKIKALFNMGEDIAHIHPNQNKIHKALKNLEFLMVNEIFPTQIIKFADIVFGVKSSYEKTGIYVNAERRMHLSKPLVETDLPDDWEVISEIAKRLGVDFGFKETEDVWNEVRVVANERFGGAEYEKFEKNLLRGLQWPVKEEDTSILHIEKFRTDDGFGYFRYNPYKLRGHLKDMIKNRDHHFYLTTGRIIAQYNNAAQTNACKSLSKRHKEDILLASEKDKVYFKGKERVVLISKYGRSRPLRVKFSKTVKRGTLYTSFHHAKSHINYLFGDEADELVKTARFKSVKVRVE
ncbi:molybdopterin oxidoreductase family protein [Nitrosophilus alvini]|uniref:molybdopterin oxidoreductase family protein n=1 Tax=Nitrosophilus alvini TaxID=2714855 RepID=UPI00190C7786|nr:molybdopterin-dependent oxidoreductase [Nitrosophilus alvini]